MACSTEFIESICALLRPLGDVRSRKMMGDSRATLNVIAELWEHLPYPKSRKKRS